MILLFYSQGSRALLKDAAQTEEVSHLFIYVKET